MTFEEVLDQALAMLQRRGRLTYRTLQLHFQLDDAHLEALKDELIYGQRLAVDEDGRVLVWTGGADMPQSAPAPAVAHTPRVEAERRQLTVLFCGLVDSTRLSGQLDPEDLRAVIRAYQETCAAVIQRFEGYIAQYLGDGLLVYFGYPQAHDDDAQRAVHTGLGLLDAMRVLPTCLPPATGMPLTVRIGIHTGPVVVGEMGAGGRHEHLALGETPNLAARLQSLAVPGTVAISDATWRLVHGYFVCQELGVHAVKGVDTPLRVWRVLGASGVQSRLDVAATRGLTPLVGREQEVGLLMERWASASEGLGQVVLLSGDGGIGKSRLVQVLKERVAHTPHALLECRSSPYYQHTALYPLIELWERTWHLSRDKASPSQVAQLHQALAQYGDHLTGLLPILAALLSLSLPTDQYPPLTLTPQQQKQHTLHALLTLVLTLAEQQPVLFILEDLHWTDPSTLEWLTLLMTQVPTARLCLLLTCRPTFRAPWEPRSSVTQVPVNRLQRAQVEQMVARLTAGKPLPAEVLAHIVAKADGVPLFVEELTKALLESGCLRDADGRYALTAPLPSLAIPATLHEALMARLDRLGAAKGVAQLGATMPETPARTQHALTLHLPLGAARFITKGHSAPEVEQASTQARALCQQVGEPPELVPVLYGLWRCYSPRSQLHTARELGDTLLRLAQQAHDPALAVLAHYALGSTWFSFGALSAARQHLEAGIARYTPEQRRAPAFRMGHDPGVACRIFAAMTLWLLGYPQQALARIQEALALAHELAHPYSLGWAWVGAAVVYQCCRDVPAVREQAEAAVTLSTAQGFPLWEAAGRSIRGWALARQGQGEEGIAQSRQGLAAWQATGSALAVPYHCTVLADIAAHLGHLEEGLQALAEAHALLAPIYAWFTEGLDTADLQDAQALLEDLGT